MKIKTLFLVALLSGCTSLPKPMDSHIDTYILATGDTVGTLYVHKDVPSDNCVTILGIDNYTAANLLRETVVGFTLDYGVHLISASYRGELCSAKDTFVTIVVDGDEPYHVDLIATHDTLSLTTRRPVQK